MDLKMGCITYDCNATQEKILSELKKFPPAKQLGFQITGMMVSAGKAFFSFFQMLNVIHSQSYFNHYCHRVCIT